MASTGLRISEALALQLSDVTRDGFLIRKTKFRKNVDQTGMLSRTRKSL